jgi:hypothetical protein
MGNFERAEKLTVEQAKAKGITMLYDENCDKYYDLDAMDFCEGDFTDVYLTEDDEPTWMFATIKIKMTMDASSVIKSALADLHEDAGDMISGDDEKELQKLLDKWCDKQVGTDTYTPNYSIAVILKEGGSCGSSEKSNA